MSTITEWKNYFRGADPEQGLIKLLSNVPVFKDLSSAELKHVREMMHIREFQNGEPVFFEGQPGNGMYIITRGAVKIVLHHDQPDEMLLVRLEPGDFFGEITLLTDMPRTAGAIADGPTELGGFFKPDLMEIIERQPRQGVKIMLSLAEVLAERLHHTNAELHRSQNALARAEADLNALKEASEDGE